MGKKRLNNPLLVKEIDNLITRVNANRSGDCEAVSMAINALSDFKQQNIITTRDAMIMANTLEGCYNTQAVLTKLYDWRLRAEGLYKL